ncbi:MAG: helix-turn-helix transcriptional regulator [Candidatus Brocadiales bacterium]|nr:helix-turn-helix transcriptional regulator [Candidatus Bathyanammoxibius sp.]
MMAMARQSINPRSVPAIAERLHRLRLVFGQNQTKFCDRTKIAKNTWNQWEKAHGRPGLDHAVRLCETLGVTLDWIYFGDASSLPHNIALKLDAIALKLAREPVHSRSLGLNASSATD